MVQLYHQYQQVQIREMSSLVSGSANASYLLFLSKASLGTERMTWSSGTVMLVIAIHVLPDLMLMVVHMLVAFYEPGCGAGFVVLCVANLPRVENKMLPMLVMAHGMTVSEPPWSVERRGVQQMLEKVLSKNVTHGMTIPNPDYVSFVAENQLLRDLELLSTPVADGTQPFDPPAVAGIVAPRSQEHRMEVEIHAEHQNTSRIPKTRNYGGSYHRLTFVAAFRRSHIGYSAFSLQNLVSDC